MIFYCSNVGYGLCKDFTAVYNVEESLLFQLMKQMWKNVLVCTYTSTGAKQYRWYRGKCDQAVRVWFQRLGIDIIHRSM